MLILYCHLSNDIKNLPILNKKNLEFIEIIETAYLDWGYKNNISNPELYGKSSFSTLS